ncbi:AGE family epimerase/isomerase [Xanthobacter autotrophicus]|jgi:mannose-6-phosphate isomerase|uniref:AGE family epimerase/isomerase n=1 Tax=Xanthobacter autotrophicus TaxID=280 RepID=A0A6C1KVL9_XANAU|nr:AGE family epimerase/isomerase [Xanthobacter autotrophicus]TLX43403.1 AGE family epimerase/isomerase [Xanthobacter autotrophicus]
MTTSPALREAATLSNALMDWLLNAALPVWHTHGIDRVHGGFHEKLGLKLEIEPFDRRTRVIARQVFCFALAGRLGWDGPWMAAVNDGIDYFFAKAMTPDGAVRMVIHADGTPKDDTFNLYDHAFALFACAAAASVSDQRAAIAAKAVAIRDRLVAAYKHPERGFEESAPRTLPLKANPHMHLFEACLAWEEIGGDAEWSHLADEIATLCLEKFLEPQQGWLREFFDGDWAPMPGEDGRICEPGHQFEWAWLLTRWGTSRNRPDARAAAVRLADLGERYGVDGERNVAINTLLDDCSIVDASARLWPQTERMKGHAALALTAPDDAALQHHLRFMAAGARSLQGYLAVETPGLWRDRMEVDGSYRPEPAPASTFYHIILGIEEFKKAIKALEART